MQQLIASMGGGGHFRQERSPGLHNIITTDAMTRLIDENPDAREELLQHLPEG